ncbi:zinc-binding dehydrogenase [Pseudomonas brassicacearum]|uniref:Enoyl reductase (ER) domain-containing protein n=1 Tax=Pseudomonas brassicacearum TaxID=930166 RepID=A0A423JL46_9PSED|nr:zinc-binding dehydrogenase [Pseudomonas brassicacearum]RON38438.1 hypothetical protein BK664_13940 [Pseudomonas brassicacearum]
MSTLQRAVLIRTYGGAGAVEVAKIEKPEPEQGQVLVQVRAAGVNGIDWKVREGAAVAAWKSLTHAGPIHPGQRILIHGAAGGLGAYAVQYAKRAAAQVFATAGTADLDYVRSLGADHVIDYQAQRFENIVRDIDLVLDYVGGKVLDRSWQVLAENGVIVGTSSPDILARTPANRRGLWFMNTPDPELLASLAKEIASGTLRSRIGEVVGFADIPSAIERNRTVSGTGKVVADFSR